MAYPEATLKYLNEYRTYILAYTVGKEMAKKCLGRDVDHWRTFLETDCRQTYSGRLLKVEMFFL